MIVTCGGRQIERATFVPSLVAPELEPGQVTAVEQAIGYYDFIRNEEPLPVGDNPMPIIVSE